MTQLFVSKPTRYLLTTLLVLAIASLTGCQKTESKKQRPTPTVGVIEAQKINLPITKEYIGVTQAVSAVDIRARVKGFLIKKSFDEGGFVKKDQLLFEIDPRPFKAKLEQSQAEFANAVAEAKFQKVEYLRMKELYAKKVISKERFDQTDTTYKKALAAVVQNKAEVENARINLSYCYMYSPINGMIGKTQVDVGNLVGGTQNTLLATVVELNPIYVEFSPSVSDFGEFLEYKDKQKNNKAPFKVDAFIPKYPKLNFHGKVSLVNNEADESTATILMRATLDNPDKLLRPGLYMKVKMILDKDNQSIAIPEAAVLNQQDGTKVYVVNQKSFIEARKVTTGTEVNGLREIKSGLKPGDKVVVTNLEQLKPDIKVNYNIVKMSATDNSSQE